MTRCWVTAMTSICSAAYAGTRDHQYLKRKNPERKYFKICSELLSSHQSIRHSRRSHHNPEVSEQTHYAGYLPDTARHYRPECATLHGWASHGYSSQYFHQAFYHRSSECLFYRDLFHTTHLHAFTRRVKTGSAVEPLIYHLCLSPNEAPTLQGSTDQTGPPAK